MADAADFNLAPKSIRTFLGASDYNASRSFYLELGFEEFVTSEQMSYFRMGGLGFYLQRYYVEDWIRNSMLFWEVDNVEQAYQSVKALDLPAKFSGVRLEPIQDAEWGREFFLHDPSGVLWHIGQFTT